jgi:RNA recognition motif-containing protein
MNIYVGNLSFDASEDDIRAAFTAFGQVTSVAIIKDQFTGKSRGFAFVEMPNTNEANAAIAGLNGKPLMGRNLTVNEARPRAEGGSRGGFGGGRKGGSGFGDRRNTRRSGGERRSW